MNFSSAFFLPEFRLFMGDAGDAFDRPRAAVQAADFVADCEFTRFDPL